MTIQLDFAYFKENYRFIAIYLSKQTKLQEPQQISFIVKLLNFFTKFCHNHINNGNTEKCKFTKRF